jgi:hypothetical protein
MTKEAIQHSLPESQDLQLVSRDEWQTNVSARQGIGDGPNANLLEPLRQYQKGDGPIEYLRQVRQGLGEQHRRLEAFWPDFKTGFARGVCRGIQEGYIPPYVEERIAPTLEKTGVGLADPRVIDPENQGFSAVYNPHIDQFRMKPAKDPSRYELDATHELYHKLSGGTFQADPKNPQHIQRQRGGYNSFPRTNGRESEHRNVDEVTIHQLALGTITGDFETLDPDKRADGNMDQYTRRKVIATFVDRAGGAIDVRSLTKAGFEDSGPDGSTELRRQLVGETVTAYGWGALRKIETLCNYAEQVAPDTLRQEVLGRIQPPQFDEVGSVRYTGRN